MQMQYNIYVELTSIVFAAMLCIYQETQYSDQLNVNKYYKRLAWSVLATTCLDVITAVTISYAAIVPLWLNVLLNSLYFAMFALLAVFFVLYVSSYVYTKEEQPKFNFSKVISLLYIFILLANLKTGWIFYFDDKGAYIHGSLYLIVFIMPLYYVTITAVMFARHWKSFKTKQRASIGFFVLITYIGPVIQLLFLPGILTSNFWVVVGLVIIHYSMETPDYELLMKTMDELKAAKEEAQEANHAKGEFLANMSHELRTPMNAMLGFNEMLINETQESHTLEYGLKVQASGRVLLSMVSDIIDFTNIDKGNLELDIKPYDTNSLLRDVSAYSKYFSELKNLESRIFIDESIPCQLSGDIARLAQVINNLISNAIKFTREGHIEFRADWVSVDENHGKLCFCVRDTGIGMRSEDIEKLTIPGKVEEGFNRFDSRNTRDIQGIGLGLTIVHRLLRLMESELKIASEYGKGSEFSFEVLQEIVNAEPIGRLDKDAADDDSTAETVKLFAPGVKVLVADDNVMNLDMFKGLLKQTGILIDTAINGKEALDLMEKNKYHMIFLDHMMPVLDGIETLREMKMRHLCTDTPTIVLTANAVAGAKENYLAEGFEDYLSKPVQRNHLIKMICKYLPEDFSSESQQVEKALDENADINQQNTETNHTLETDIHEEMDEQGFLSSLTFLDTETGMAYCADSEEFYREMLASYLANRRDIELEDFYKKEDWENYRIAVHALKSTSLSIGAVNVSEEAKALEEAAKENDISYLTAKHGNLMKNYTGLLSNIDAALNGEEEITKQSNVAVSGDVPHIFAVDDDMMNLRIIEKMLADEFSVTCFDNGEKLLELLKKELPDMILLDVRMPGMDGFEVLKQLKENEQYKEIPVIFLTADEGRDTEVEGFKAGVLDFIRKPFVSEIMIQRVKRILQIDRLQKDLQSEVEKQTREIVEQRNQVERLNEEIIHTLAGAIDAKDAYTNGHSNRVAEYARSIAIRLGKSDEEVNNIYFAGLLHDVGKIGIPDDIINKPGKLTDEEYATIKTHPAIGANILSNISGIQDIATGAHWHHERYDGRGYPDGLKGEEIPEMARIIGVADTYDAMTSKRSYRGVLPQDVVREELVKGRGTQFDPIFTDVMLSLMDEDKEYKMKEQD